MRSKITRILSYKHQKHQKNYSTFRQFSNYTHHSALFRGAKLRNSGTSKGQVTVLIYDNTLLLFRIRTCPRPLAYCPPGRCFSLSSNPRALPPVTHGSALQAPERIWRPIRDRKGIYWTGLNGIERKLNEMGDFRTVLERFWTNLTSPAQIRNFAMQFASNNIHLSGATELLA